MDKDHSKSLVTRTEPNRLVGKVDVCANTIFSVTVECPTCGDEFSKRRSMHSHHTQIHGESLTKKQVSCRNCGKDFKVSNWRFEQSTSFYCSTDCRKTGEVVGCENCGEQIYRNQRRLEKRDEHFCSSDCHNEWQGRNKLEFECEICGDTFTWSPSRTDNHNPRYCSLKCRNSDDEWVDATTSKANRIQQEKDGPTDIELQGREILTEIGVEFKEQVTIGDKFCVDVYLPDDNIIIQWDGDYWHCHPDYENPDERQLNRKTIDKSQNAYFKECGYSVLRFWGRTIRNNPEKVKRQIVNELEAFE